MSYQVPNSESSDDLVTFLSADHSPAPQETIMGDMQPAGNSPAQPTGNLVSQEQLQELFNELQGLRQRNDELQAQLQNTNANPTVPQVATPVPAQPPTRPRMRLPDLPKFDGDRRKYKAWKMQVKMKLRVDAEAVGDEMAKIGLIFNALEKTALANMSSMVYALEKSENPKVQTLIEHLDKSYSNPHETQQARQRLATMKQGTRRFVNFLPEFEQCLADAEGHEWPEDVKQDRLCEAISPKILEAMVGRTWPKTYDETVALFRQIAEDQYYLSQRNSETAKSFGRSSMTLTPKPEVDVMDWEPTITTKLNTQESGNPNGNPKGPGLPNDELLVGKRARWVSKKEMNRRKAEKLCWRCARKGCHSKICPLAAPIRPGIKADNTGMEAYDLSAVIDEASDGGSKVHDITEQGKE